MKEINSPLYDLRSAIRHLSYDDMMLFAAHIGHESGALALNPTGMQGDEITEQNFAAAIRSFVEKPNDEVSQ